MGNGTGKKTESIPQSAATLLSQVLMGFSALCAILVLVFLPLYFQEGYSHIGSDKSYFFRTATVWIGKFLLPVFGLWAVARIAQAVIEPSGTGEMTRPGVGRLMFVAGHLSATDVFALCYAVSAVLSWLCSNYRSTALWGTKGWYMGMIPQLTLVSIYFLLSRFESEKITKWLLVSCLPVSTAVFLLGLLNRFGIWPIPMADSGRALYISTVGNINWYCCYAVTVLFVGVGLFWTDRSAGGRTGSIAHASRGGRTSRSMVLAIYILTGFMALLTQGSESGIFAMLVVFWVLFLLSAFSQDERKVRRFWQLCMLLAVAGLFIWLLRVLFPGRMNYTSRLGMVFYSPLSVLLLLASATGYIVTRKFYKGNTVPTGQENTLMHGAQKIAKFVLAAVPIGLLLFIGMIVLNTLRPGSLGALSDKAVFTFGPKWGSSRGATWTIGLRCFAEQDYLHRFTGVGPDCMADFLYTDASDGLLTAARDAFGNKRLTNAHCELLTVLVNMGIFGAVSYAGFWLSLLKRLLLADGADLADRTGRADQTGGADQADLAVRGSNLATACGLGMLAYLLNNLWSFQQSLGAATVFVVMGLGAYFELLFISKNGIL